MQNFKLSLILVVILGLSITIKAQSKFGFRAGFQTGNIYNSGNSYLDKSLNTFYVGAFKEFKIIPLLKFDVGVDFNQNGSLNDSLSRKLSYISIPLDLKVKLGPIFAIAGVAPSLKLAEKWTYNDVEEDIGNLKSNLFDMPTFVGIGFKVAIISIEARYYIGTLSLNDNDLSGFKDYKSQYLQLGLAISF